MGLNPILALLKSKHNETVGNAIATLMYLFSNHTKSEIKTYEVESQMKDFSMSSDKMLANLATVFLEDICRLN